MCMAKRPKPISSAPATEKPIEYLRNPYLDGIDPLMKARQGGMKSLRIDRGSGKAPVTGLQSPAIQRVSQGGASLYG